MIFKVSVPSKRLVEAKVRKVIAEAENGAFCLLPQHIDFVASLAPGLFFYETEGGEEVFLAINEGILLKCGEEVLVSTRQAVRGPALGALKETIEKEFQVLDERGKKARAAAAKLEANLVRRFLELGGHGR